MPRLEFIQEGSSTPCQWGEGLNLIPSLTREMQGVRGDAGEEEVHRHCPSLPPRKQMSCLEEGGRGMPFTIFKKYLFRVHWVFVAA